MHFSQRLFSKWLTTSALVAGTLLLVGSSSLSAWYQAPATPSDLHQDRVERNRANRDIRHDKRAIRRDQRQVQRDLNTGHYKAAKREVNEVQRKERRLDKDQRERNRDNRDIRRDQANQ